MSRNEKVGVGEYALKKNEPYWLTQPARAVLVVEKLMHERKTLGLALASAVSIFLFAFRFSILLLGPIYPIPIFRYTNVDISDISIVKCQHF